MSRLEHSLMLKSIADNLKHLRAFDAEEPEEEPELIQQVCRFVGL